MPEVRDELDPRDGESCNSMGQLEISYGDKTKGLPIVGLVVIDPRGRKIGRDPLGGKLWQELPQAQAFIDCDQDENLAAAGHCGGSIQICGPLSGTYKLKVIASGSGRYFLAVSGLSQKMKDGQGLHSTDSWTGLEDREIQKGSRDTLLLSYSREPGFKVRFVGAKLHR